MAILAAMTFDLTFGPGGAVRLNNSLTHDIPAQSLSHIASAMLPFHSSNFMTMPPPVSPLPGPISTLEFRMPDPVQCGRGGVDKKNPLHSMDRVLRTAARSETAAPGRKRRRSGSARIPPPPEGPEDCCICLEIGGIRYFHIITITRGVPPPRALSPHPNPQRHDLPCQHSFHAPCLWGVLTNLCLGSHSMMRCPLCRYSVDRYDLQAMGYDVRPSNLRRISWGCTAYHDLVTGALSAVSIHPGGNSALSRSSRVTRAILRSATLTSMDGYVFNTCLLSLHRMIFHKINFAESLHQQMLLMPARGNDPAATCDERIAFVNSSLDCHIDVLIHTAQQRPEG